jgi:replication factor C subunit 3/5
MHLHIRYNVLTLFRHRLSTGASEKLQLSALLGAFKNAVEISAK